VLQQSRNIKRGQQEQVATRKEPYMLNSRRFAVLLVMLVACGCENTRTPPPPKPLFERLGGMPAIQSIVDDFVARGAANPKVNFTRKGIAGAEWDPSPTNMERLKKMLVEFIASAAGGPVKYSGKDMLTVHKGMQITNAEFDALAADLKASLDAHKVGAIEQRELLDAVEGTRKQIVEIR
jgi:hemoglobin